MSDFLERLEDEAPTLSTLAQVAEVAKSLRELDSAIEDAEIRLKELTDARKKLTEDTLPSIMQANGITDLDLRDEATGLRYSLSLSEDLYIRIPANEEGRKEAYKFLYDHGGGHLIKEQLIIEDAPEGIKDRLRESETPFEEKSSVNTNSLTAWGRSLVGLKKGTVATVEITDFPKSMNPFMRKVANLKIKT